MKDYQYYGLFLDTDTKNMLMDTLTDNIDYNIALNVADKIFIDHCTLLHKSHVAYSQLINYEDLQSCLDNALGKSISIKLRE